MVGPLAAHLVASGALAVVDVVQKRCLGHGGAIVLRHTFAVLVEHRLQHRWQVCEGPVDCGRASGTGRTGSGLPDTSMGQLVGGRGQLALALNTGMVNIVIRQKSIDRTNTFVRPASSS